MPYENVAGRMETADEIFYEISNLYKPIEEILSTGKKQKLLIQN